jgi:DNA-binding transcriptional MerR regulator
MELWLPIAEAAEMLGVTERAIRYRISKGAM